ncbi:MAG TPA: OB-fold nucleic acid binding domain-containing protein, partial [Bacteroidota bacterium]|nr:OB-fold nucleic acid binding domain-containing protein [Bacteroidota bacterium]
MDQNPEAGELNDQMARRRQELDELRTRGIDPYPHTFERTALSADIVAAFRDGAPEFPVTVAGRIMSLRRMGKASFFHLEDSRGRIQVYLRQNDLGEVYDAFRLMDLGDIVGVEGFVFRTKTGEVSVHARRLVLLA